MDVYETIVKRRSIRRFQDITVPYEILEKCVDAGRLAPSAKNTQLCEYIIIDNEQLLPKVFDSITMWAGQENPARNPQSADEPTAYIVTLINKQLEAELNMSRRVTTYDVGLSAENMILVALEQGVGACAILSFDESKLKQLLNVPDNYYLALLIALGYPTESPVTEVSADSINYWVDDQGIRHIPKRSLEDILHRNRFP